MAEVNAAAKNLERIKQAIVRHNGNCDFPIIAILMNPFEVDRLGWDDFEGIPIRGDDRLPTGRFELLCDGHHGAPQEEHEEEAEAVLIETIPGSNRFKVVGAVKNATFSVNLRQAGGRGSRAASRISSREAQKWA